MSSSQKLTTLRNAMRSRNIQAIIVPTDDAHASEYVAPCDGRRHFISGFTGSAGTAVVTTEKAALWTDGRYFVQANNELTLDHWILQKQGLMGTPSITQWLSEVLPKQSTVYVDGTLYAGSAFSTLQSQLTKSEIKLTSTGSNLVDDIWSDRPARPNNALKNLSISICGKSWQEKFSELREKMSSTNCDFVLLSALDDIAWITNIRGSDIHCASCFFSYLLITQDQAFLYSQQPSSDPVFEEFKDNLTVLPYDSAVSDIPSKIGDKKAWTEVSLNHAIASQISNKIETSVSHVCMMKCCKNETEKKSMYSANLKAARAISKYLAWLQNGNWKHHDEVSASDKLYDLYAAENDFMSLSFDTISSTGPSGAILHYKAKRESCKKIIENTTYLVDSGCQYLDGTTDTTRTVWIGDGEVNDYIKECYTRVLKGHIQIASVKFPEGTRGYQIDSLARKALWDAGLDFLHGTGHGVGQYGNVHENPRSMGISSKFVSMTAPNDDDKLVGHDSMTWLRPGYIVSNEPGYYQEGDDGFGIRLENVIMVKDKAVEKKHKHFLREFYQFTDLIFCPYEMRLIDVELLDEDEKKWMNWYSENCRKNLLPILEGDDLTKKWVEVNTVKI